MSILLGLPLGIGISIITGAKIDPAEILILSVVCSIASEVLTIDQFHQ